MAIDPIILAGNYDTYSASSILPMGKSKKSSKRGHKINAKKPLQADTVTFKNNVSENEMLKGLKGKERAGLKQWLVDQGLIKLSNKEAASLEKAKAKEVAKAEAAAIKNYRNMYGLDGEALKGDLTKTVSRDEVMKSINAATPEAIAADRIRQQKAEAEFLARKTGQGAGEIVPNNKSIWRSIKNHPWITGAVVLAVAAGAYLATRKDDATIDEAA